MKKSLGLIETIGLTAGIVAADTAVKSANVELVGYELSRGSGMTVIKVEGDVGAVKSAIDAASANASKVGRVVSTKVIPRPSEYLETMVRNKDTVGYVKEIEDTGAEEKNNETKIKIETKPIDTVPKEMKKEAQAESSKGNENVKPLRRPAERVNPSETEKKKTDNESKNKSKSKK